MDFSVFLYHKLYSCNVQNNNKKENVQNQDTHRQYTMPEIKKDCQICTSHPKTKKINNLTMDELQAKL